MASERVPIQHWEDVNGLDYKATDLTRDASYYKDLQNYQFWQGDSIRGRAGCKIVAGPGSFITTHTYSYFDTVTGANQQELLALNDELFKLVFADMSITRVAGSTNWNIKINLDPASAHFRLVINQNSLPVSFGAVSYMNLGTGTEDIGTTNYISILDVYSAIDGLTNFSAVMPTRTARVHGLQSNVYKITVDAGHTFVAGDTAVFWDFVTNKLVARFITAVTATTIEWADFLAREGGPRSESRVTVKDNQVIGVGGMPAACLQINDAYTSTSDTQQIRYGYWAHIPAGTDRINSAPFRTWYAAKADINFAPPVFVNSNQCCYIFGQGGNQTRKPYEDAVWKYDGKRVYRAGTPPFLSTITSSLGVGALTGVYKYALRFVTKDSFGVERAGNDSDMYAVTSVSPSTQNVTLTFPPLRFNVAAEDIAVVYGDQTTVTTINVDSGHSIVKGDWIMVNNTYYRQVSSVTSTTITIAGDSVSVADNSLIYRNANIGFCDRGAIVKGNQAAVTTITVYPADGTLKSGHDVRIGDVVYFYNRKIGQMAERIVTAITVNSFSFSSSYESVSVYEGDIISVGARVEIYRTRDAGNQFYHVHTLPNNPYAETMSFVDSYLDTEILIEMDRPSIGQEDDLPPFASIGCLHQGVMVYSGILGAPNQIGASKVDNLEAVPLASNYIEISSNVTGPITAIASDTDDKLAVFKPDSYYDLNGDFTSVDGLFISPIRITEGDYGISSQASLQKINGMLVGIGYMGIIAVKGGGFVKYLFGKQQGHIGHLINSAIQGNRNINLKKAVAINNRRDILYQIYIPGLVNGIEDVSEQLMFAGDFENDPVWFNWKYPSNIEPNGGMAVLASPVIRGAKQEAATEDLVYHLCKNGTFPGVVFRQLNSATIAQNYADNHLAIEYITRGTFEHLGDLLTNKTFLRLVIYSFYGSTEMGDFTPFTMTVKTYRDFQEVTAHTSTSVSFATGDYVKKIGLADGQACALQLYTEVEGIGQCPQFTGYEYKVAQPYESEDVRK